MGYSWLSKLWNRTIGSLGKHIAQNWDHARPYLAAAASIAAAVAVAWFAPQFAPAFITSHFATAVFAGAAGGFTGGFTGTALSGGNLGQAFKSGLIGGAVGGVLGGIGYEISGGNPSFGKLASNDPSYAKFYFTSTMRQAQAAAIQRSLVSGITGGVLGTGLSVGEFLSAAGSGAAHGLYNATVGAAVSGFNSGANHMAASWMSFSEGDYAMGALHATAMAGDVAGLALTAVGAGQAVGAGARFAAAGLSGFATQGETALLRSHVQGAIARLESEGLTAAQERALLNNPKLQPAFEGERIDAFFRESVANDPALQHLELTPRFKFGPDVFDPATQRWWDVTTPAQWETHTQKYWLFGDGTPLFTK